MQVYVVVPFRDRPLLLDECLKSIVAQEDPFWLIVADDASTDPLVTDVIDRARGHLVERQTARRPITVIRRSHNVGAVRNITEAIRSVRMKPEDVVLIVDGDDRLAHGDVIRRLREVYAGTEVDFCYGSYRPDGDCPDCPPAEPIPLEVLLSGGIRSFTDTYGQLFNHPISFRRRLFDQIADDDLKMDGEWMRYAYDRVLGLPLLELAGDRVMFLPDVLYVYTADQPESVAVAHRDETDAENNYVTRLPQRYDPMPPLEEQA